MQEYFTAGELSVIFNVNVQTLHYYDSIGLLRPSMRDARSGTRLYKFDQVYKLTTIKYQQKLGKSLKQIKAYLDSRNIINTLDDLKHQLNIVHEKINELKIVEQIIEEKATFIEHKLAEMECADTKSVVERYFGARPYIAAEGDEFQFGNDYFYVYPTVVFHEEGKKSFGVLVPDSFSLEHPLADLSFITEGSYLCGYHVGSYETIFSSFERLCSIAKSKRLSMVKRYVCFNIIDQFVEPDCEKYVTQIQIKII